jgi:hypothetical protein
MNFVGHGFARTRAGNFTSFDATGSKAPFGTAAFAINPSGAGL